MKSNPHKAKVIFKPNPGSFSDEEVLGIDGDGEFIPVQNYEEQPDYCPGCGLPLNLRYYKLDESKKAV